MRYLHTCPAGFSCRVFLQALPGVPLAQGPTAEVPMRWCSVSHPTHVIPYRSGGSQGPLPLGR